MNTKFHASISRFLDSPRTQQGLLTNFLNSCLESENQIIKLHESQQQGLPDSDYADDDASVELGFVLYWLQNPSQEIIEYLERDPILRRFWDYVRSQAPNSNISMNLFNAMHHSLLMSPYVAKDGTLIGFSKYEQGDLGWTWAALNYAANVIDSDLIFQPFPAAIPPAFNLTSLNGGNEPVLCLLGDWGTGMYSDHGGVDCPAQRALDSIEDQHYDYLIHLGDVYYSGTDDRPWPGEEDDNLVSVWPFAEPERSFTLNSNHEMCGGAYGYFDVALTSGVFNHQQGISRFHLNYGPWLILGLDSAYYSDEANGLKFYLDGAIGTNTETTQAQWLQTFSNHNGPIMIMSHHGPCATFSAKANLLFNQVVAALGREPDVWYWGHLHAGVVYKQLFDSTGNNFVNTLGRCAGHSAMPYGHAWGFDGNANIDYLSHTPDPLLPPASKRMLNGYCLITLHQDGSFTERFFETENPVPLYSKTWQP